MASQVLSGPSNPTYTNNTGQNVRIIINYMQNVSSMSWAGVTEAPFVGAIQQPTGRATIYYTWIAPLVEFAIGKGIDSFMDAGWMKYIKEGGHFPSEIALAPGQSFSAICGVYNIVVIKEDGN